VANIIYGFRLAAFVVYFGFGPDYYLRLSASIPDQVEDGVCGSIIPFFSVFLRVSGLRPSVVKNLFLPFLLTISSLMWDPQDWYF